MKHPSLVQGSTSSPHVELLHEAVQRHRNPRAHASYNPVGATVFILYILSALVIIFHLAFSLRASYKTIPNSVTLLRSFRLRLWAITLASLASFMTLSFNMLAFLISSFIRYQNTNSLQRSTDPLTLGPQTWTWTTHSELFTDFASDLVMTPTSLLATQYALRATMFGTILLVALGKSDNIPKLEWYFVLAQILPVSFAVSLLFVDVFLRQHHADTSHSQPNGSNPTAHTKPENKNNINRDSNNKDSKPITRHSITILFYDLLRPAAIIYLYPYSASYIPNAFTPDQLLHGVALARILLTAVYPLNFSLQGLRVGVSMFLATLPSLITVAALQHLHGVAPSLFELVANESYAVKTLFHDALVLLIICSVAYWAFGLREKLSYGVLSPVVCLPLDWIVAWTRGVPEQ